jgi:MYXO-CTERM domain-containing protein
MIGPLLRVAASSVAARSLRTAAQDAMTSALLALGAALAMAVGAVFLSFSAYAFLESRLDPASASGIVGLFWLLAGGGYFAVARRRRT